MKTGVSTACLYPLEPERSLDLLLQLGYRRFEVFPNCMEELSPAYLRDLKGRAEAYGAEFVSLHPFTSAMESSLLFGDYPRRTREAFDFYRRYMAAAAYLGAKYVVIHGQPQGHGKLPDEGYWQRFGELYRIGYEEGAFPAQENVRQHRGGCARLHRRDAPVFGGGLRLCAGREAVPHGRGGNRGHGPGHGAAAYARAPQRRRAWAPLPAAWRRGDGAYSLPAAAGGAGLWGRGGDRGLPGQLFPGEGAGKFSLLHKKSL